MYSWEIDRLLKIKNYLISTEDYFKITNTRENPQIKQIEYNPEYDFFRISTNDNYNFKFKVKKKTR